MSANNLIKSLASRARLTPEYLISRGAVEKDQTVVIPYNPGGSRSVIVASSGTTQHGMEHGPELFGYSEASTKPGVDLIVVPSGSSQLLLGQHGFRSVAVVSREDASLIGSVNLSKGERFVILREQNSPWLVDSIRYFGSRADILERVWVAELPKAVSTLFDVQKKGPTSFSEAIDNVIDAAIPLSEYVSTLPGVILSDVTPETVRWLWPGWIPLGKNTDVSADPGVGKTLVLEGDLAARVTTGRDMPDGAPGIEGGVVIVNGEDDPGDTLLRRILSAGGDPSRVLVLSIVRDSKKGSKNRLIIIPDDIPKIETAIRRVNAKLVVVDPLPSFLSRELSANVDQDVRHALAQLGDLASRTGAAVITVRHLNKSQAASAIYRASGSIGITGIARASHIMAKVPGNEELRVLACVKSNLAPEPKPLGFRIVENDSGVPMVEWTGTIDVDINDLLAPPRRRASAPKLDEAIDFVTQQLESGPLPSKTLEARVISAGISGRTLERAREKLHVVSKPSGFQGEFVCSLPGRDQDPETPS